MTRPCTVDIHAPILPEETIRRFGTEAPGLAPKLIPQGDGRSAEELLRNGRP